MKSNNYLTTIVALLVVGLLPSAGMAHYVYEKDKQLKGSACVKIYSEVSHGKYKGGFYKSTVELYHRKGAEGISSGGVCKSRWHRARGKIKMKQYHQKFNKKSRTWKTCTATKGWSSNSKHGYSHTVKVRHNKRMPKCGAGLYRNLTHVKIDGALYKLQSGKHSLPAK